MTMYTVWRLACMYFNTISVVLFRCLEGRGANLYFVAKVTRERVDFLCLSNGMVAAGRRPWLHPMDHAFMPRLMLRPEGTMVQHSSIRHLYLCLSTTL